MIIEKYLRINANGIIECFVFIGLAISSNGRWKGLRKDE